MKFNELEIRILDWARRNICSAFPDKTFQRVAAEAAVIVVTRRIEAHINSVRPMLADAGLLTADGDVQTAAIRDVVLPALKNAGGLEFSMMGKRFSIEASDFDSILGNGEGAVA